MTVICVIGQPGSGKDTLAKFFTEIGFVHFSTGDIIREEMRRRGIPTDRENMRLFSSKMRGIRGNEYPADIVTERIAINNSNAVVSGPRNLKEIDFLRSKFKKNFLLVVVDAPMKIRYDRVVAGRGREGDNILYAQFKAQEEAECGSGTHEVAKAMQQADVVINNSSTEEELSRKVKLVEFFCSL